MQAIALKPSRMRYAALYLSLLMLAVCSMLLPAAALPAALLIPLCGGPLMRSDREWIAWIACAVPSAVALVCGYDVLYSLSLLLPGTLCFLALTRRRKDHLSTPRAMALCIASYAVALTLIAFCGSLALGEGLANGLAALLMERVANAQRPGLVLYRLATMGLVNVPKAYQNANLLLFAFDPALIRQMTLSLRLTLDILLSRMIPTFFAQVCLLGGIFTALLYTQFRGASLLVETNPRVPSERKTYVLPVFRFRMLTLPRPLRWPLLGAGLLGVLLVAAGGSLETTLGWLLCTVFSTVVQLQGAAASMFWLARHSPEHTALHGALIAILYVLMPPVLFWIGLADLIFHLRAKNILNHDEEE